MNDDSSKARAILAICVGMGILALTGLLLVYTPSQAAQPFLNTLLGALLGAFATQNQFYFGTSSGSKTLLAQQNKTVDALTQAVATSYPVVTTPPESIPAGDPPDPDIEALRKQFPKLSDPELANLRDAVKKMKTVDLDLSK